MTSKFLGLILSDIQRGFFMSSILETSVMLDTVFEGSNDTSGLLIITDADSSNFILINEIEGEASAADPGDDIVFGGSQFDFISTGDGDDILRAGDGDDIIIGGAGNDIINAGDGTDIIDGGTGNDILIGGEGSDIFRYQLSDFENGDVDRILDFESGVDQLQINGVDPSLVTLEDNAIKYDGETIISIEGENNPIDDSDLEIF